MKIRSQRNQLIDMVGKATTTVRTPTGSYQILAHALLKYTVTEAASDTDQKTQAGE